VRAIGSITGIPELLPDDKLYAGGISLMTQGQYLNPHLDNSHDKDRVNYRVLNPLYYVRRDFGGPLELGTTAPEKRSATIHNRFNRLVVMQTDERSCSASADQDSNGETLLSGGTSPRHTPSPSTTTGYCQISRLGAGAGGPPRDLGRASRACDLPCADSRTPSALLQRRQTLVVGTEPHPAPPAEQVRVFPPLRRR
jgi:hypothetical protein